MKHGSAFSEFFFFWCFYCFEQVTRDMFIHVPIQIRNTLLNNLSSYSFTLHYPSFSILYSHCLLLSISCSLSFTTFPLLLPPPLLVCLCACMCVVIRRHRCNRVKSPWSWNAPTSTFKLDSISTAGSDKRVCVSAFAGHGLVKEGRLLWVRLRMRAE